jgi:DNA-binding NtrC family response regulator
MTTAGADAHVPDAGTSRRRVLLVDDDDSLRDAVRRALEESGSHDVVACSTFEAAKRHLHEHAIDVLLTDVRLGAFNGLQLAVLARDLHPKAQLLVFSGFDDPVLREEAANLGATYLVKPVTAATLLDLMR